MVSWLALTGLPCILRALGLGFRGSYRVAGLRSDPRSLIVGKSMLPLGVETLNNKPYTLKPKPLYPKPHVHSVR